MTYKNNTEYEKDKAHWLSDFHYGGSHSNIFTAKRLLEQSKWEKADMKPTIKPSHEDGLDEILEQFMSKGLDEDDPKHQQYSQIAMWLAELKVRRCATPADVQPVVIHQDKNGNELNNPESWENAIGHAFQSFLVVDTLAQSDKSIAVSLQKIKHLCHSMQRWLGFDERQINSMCADLNIKTRANDWS